MGRTSKFTFPVPGRKQKPPFGPIVSGPMSKAQKILGTAEINIDAPRQWDSASNSGISESEIVPAFLTNRFAQLSTEGGQREFTTETSSLARRGSNSTITSWYDKTKMPLSISQQTSSSAMAKGLPQKANAVLDIEGQSSTNVPAPLNLKAKKRPSRLDLGPLLSRAKHNSLKGKSDPQRASSVHGQEYTNRSPSLASVTSPKSTPPPIQQRIERKLTRKSTYDSLNSTGSRPRTGSSSRRGANDISTLPNLYEHYEQMSFDSCRSHTTKIAVHNGPPKEEFLEASSETRGDDVDIPTSIRTVTGVYCRINWPPTDSARSRLRIKRFKPLHQDVKGLQTNKPESKWF
ncbi:hypothetical protein COL5a_005827 [Colletotrichum fioriniae]|nr:hypothetical protein COL5a_005827 [Colletotrichum fioriniae]